MTPLMGFAPDVESTTPGVLVDCAQLIPFESGMEAAPGLTVPTGVGVLAADCRGVNTDGALRLEVDGKIQHLLSGEVSLRPIR